MIKTKMAERLKSNQMSETLTNAIFLTLYGGCQDACTYLCRGKVFANAQTGNIVLMSTHFFEGEFGLILHYLIPVISFIFGICVAEIQHIFFKNYKKIHWRQIVLTSLSSPGVHSRSPVVPSCTPIFLPFKSASLVIVLSFLTTMHWVAV